LLIELDTWVPVTVWRRLSLVCVSAWRVRVRVCVHVRACVYMQLARTWRTRCWRG
jgi:hypothetical protein